MYQPTLSYTTPRRWTPAEDHLLHRLRFIEHKTWPEIAQDLGRTTPAVQGHYQKLKVARSSSFEDWDTAMDHFIIDGRHRGLTSKEIGAEMDIPGEAVQGRWYELQQQRKVPEDVLAIWRRKGEVVWSGKEDEVILKAWMEGMSDDEIVECVRFEGKYKCDVRERRRILTKENGPVYRRLMGLEAMKSVPHALDKALGMKKFAWMQ
ncbi:hypothetical protein BU25DRAFT_262553 [Macroventuria anomochaeta]|uniref:Uncharacterized protein n=1 Tax=Macroventuria anomochaeta TaxID=301207 RepID=A0ACB6S9U5_9PLEO|nr:uncharacterized protein BU25DRAFT_262553 [Macroventuria anomochaeta]KAF2629994.1 hypothetical protein BU25DRAFT_262553 [Macroventuria anomochaeta]